jgi:hypothetical protein
MRKPEHTTGPLPDLIGTEAEAPGTVSAVDKEDAAGMWKTDTSPAGRALLDAPEYEGEDGG